LYTLFNMNDTILSKLVRYIHLVYMGTLIFGVFLPSKYLIYYLFLLPALFIHWYLNNNRCMLVELESHFDNNYLNINVHEEVRYYQFQNIFKMLKNFNIRLYDGDLFISLIINVSIICWIIGFIRFIIYYRKNILNIWSVIKHPLSKRVLHDKYK
jgi:hypothetical protein